ncbi:hypothetical protein [Billgrantia kenyensis]|uniref:Glycosyltransferase RgtA/B/C/D-like domain-containing protein n=1 Tax=Billgrantia kenyensis TaxID=321266 RepID=A0A7V9W0V2_9GAMM|nr:hypothetical protein [Halomonas kenyensis]MBA2778994.1 hypothetical protein [Halomonas kenyensis]MCG6662921.1 hypothetical protein [Halomonas kenyensis]
MADKVFRSDSGWFFIALSLSLVIYGAIPFLALPTLGQALGTTVGFAQSLLNEGGFSLYAKNFGYPTPMPRSFGLSGVLVTEFFLWVGLSPADAYTSMTVLFLVLAFWGAYRFSVFLGASNKLASVLSLLWLSQPVVWNHSGYSMLSLGISLLPLYIYVIFLLCTPLFSLCDKIRISCLFVFVCVVSVFMDGYTYMMFAVAASFIWLFTFCKEKKSRSHMLLFSTPIMFVGFSLSYVLYVLYIGQTSFHPSSMSFFRGWGLDLTFLFIPTQGVHWVWDLLGLSINRSSKDFFGDASVWITTFSIPIILVGFFSWWKERKKIYLATLFSCIAIFAFYMSLGPSLKVNAVKSSLPDGGEYYGASIPETMDLMSTGNSVIYGNVPGFKSMRATYRWHALFVFSMWGLVIILAARCEVNNNRIAAFGIPLVLLVTIFPNPVANFSKKWDNRLSAFQLEEELLLPLGESISKRDVVAFLPYRNDILVNYLSSMLDFTTYNVGGDKNLIMAKPNWPLVMKASRHGWIDSDIKERIYHILSQNKADAVVLLYIDSIKGIHSWPSPPVYEEDFKPIVSDLQETGWVDVVKHEYFVIIQPSDDLPENYQMNGNGFSVGNFSYSNYHSQVGELRDENLVSTAAEGFLHFGPYKYLPAGRYGLVVKGESYSSESAWIDVVSEKGGIKHFEASLSGSSGAGVLSQAEFEIKKDVIDFEVRVFVSEEDHIILQGYEVFPVAEIILDE